jgi:hypothetical protein
MVAKLLKFRLEHPDCNAGAMFDNYKNDKVWKTYKDLLEIVFLAIKTSKVHIIALR